MDIWRAVADCGSSYHDSRAFSGRKACGRKRGGADCGGWCGASGKKQPKEKSPPAYLQTPEIEVDGNFYVGTVSFPSLGHSLPVMSDWSYAKLELSPCRYAGSAYLDNMIFAAHNYPGHFGPLLDLEAGKAACFEWC